jgi:hypothetical protein
MNPKKGLMVAPDGFFIANVGPRNGSVVSSRVRAAIPTKVRAGYPRGLFQNVEMELKQWRVYTGYGKTKMLLSATIASQR